MRYLSSWYTVFFVALALRVAFIIQWLHLPLSKFQLIDSSVFDQWAMAIANGKDFGGPAFYLSPFYPYLLALIFKIAGHHLTIVFLIQAIAGSAMCVIIGRATALLFGFWPGIAAGLLTALYRPYIFYSALLMKETWGLVGTALFCWIIIKTVQKPSARALFVSGFVLGFTALCRGNILLVAPFIAVWFLWQRPFGSVKKTFVPVALFAAGIIVAAAPTTIRNYLRSGDLVMINYAGGFTFYLGNRESPSGFDNYPPGVSSNPSLEEVDSTRVAENAEGRKLKPSEVSFFWFKQGLKLVTADVNHWFVMEGRKLYAFWNHLEVPDNYNLEFTERIFTTVLNGPLTSFTLVSVLAVAGIVMFRTRETRFLVYVALMYMISVILFSVNDRYRMPMVVFLLPFAGAAAVRIIEKVLQKNLKALSTPGLAALPFLLVALAPPPYLMEALYCDGWGVLTVNYFRMNRYEDSVHAYEKSLQISREWTKPEAHFAAALAYGALDRNVEAERILKRIIADQEDGNAMNAYSLLLIKLRRYAEAYAVLQQAQKAMPNSQIARQGLCVIQLKLKKKLDGKDNCAGMPASFISENQ